MSSGDAPHWTDSHCHIQDAFLDDPDGVDAVLDRAVASGVDRLVCVGTGGEESRQAVELARRVAATRADVAVWAAVGLHPHEASRGVASITTLLDRFAPAAGPRAPGSVVGVGECGLDYYYEHSPRDAQREAFAAQIGLAQSHGLALVVHTRDAWDDTFDILGACGAPRRTVIHCFSGGEAEARRCLDLGAYLSFSGIVTFKNARAVREAAVICPADRLLVETDAPFLAPVPFRGKPNEPARVALVGAALAEIRGEAVEELAATTNANVSTLFSLGA
ncbi:MAG TPA: TatD family hydrolase [Acidimicrobiales bacterium]|nr:TatD family hydrolase [Acidimicrobiales bacterium]